MNSLKLMVALVFLATASDALAAEESPYCRKVRALAENQAALLMAPELVSQGFRFPVNTVDPTLVGGRGQFQLRVGLALSLSDFYRGIRTMTAAHADCDRQRVQAEIEEMLPHVRDLGKLAALRTQIAYLESHRARWKKIAKSAEERLAVHAITFIDYHELQKRVILLDRRVAQVQGEAARIEALEAKAPTAQLPAITEQYQARSDNFEREAAHVRALQGWQLRVTGGLVPLQVGDRGVIPGLDWYGLVELRFSFGVLKGNGDYLSARDEEVKQARYEVVSKVQTFRREAGAVLAQAKKELESVDLQATSTTRAREMLERNDAPNLGQAVAMLKLDEIWFESERLYLQTLVKEITAFMGRDNG